MVGKTRKRVAMELVVDLERVYARKKAANKELVQLVKSTGTGLLDLHGIGPSGAARLLVEVGDITRFPTAATSRPGPAPPPSTPPPATTCRHRLSRGGNRQINKVLHMMAVVQLRNPTEGRTYYDRKIADGKVPTKPCACLKRRLSDIVYRTMLNDPVAAPGDRPGRTPGNVSDIQRGRLTSPHRLFGQVTSRTRHHQAYDPTPQAS